MQEQYTILVVDDEPDLQPLILQRMRRDIRAGRYHFVFAQNGIEALQKLSQDDGIDMVLSDINMPQMDGLTLLEQIPKVDPNVRSVIISAYGDMKNIRTAMNRGAFDFVTKPIDFEDLKVTIGRTLRHMAEWREALLARDKLVVLQNELSVARQMQQSILPTQFPQSPGYSVYGKMEAARNVGGDFYEVLPFDDGQIGLAIADVSDKGVPAALFMMASRTLLKSIAMGQSDPGQVLGELNELLEEDNEEGMFVTLVYGVYDPSTRELTYANGGHNSPVVVHRDGTSELLPLTEGIALGVQPMLRYAQNTVQLSPGDRVVFYTDGVTEAMDGDGEQFGLERLSKLFESPAAPQDPESANLLVFDAVNTFVGDTPQSDDITCLTLSCSEA
ncbi:MAG: SpoIIE family protein phosphatase [Actinomycetia bacterium]|nr:SpoIIE family protein phosphatase [Actinomycetes bacterium]